MKENLDIVETRPLGEFRMWTPNGRFVPEQLQQRYWGKKRDGQTGRFWITGIMLIDEFGNHKFIPNQNHQCDAPPNRTAK